MDLSENDLLPPEDDPTLSGSGKDIQRRGVKIHFDLRQVEALATLQCTNEEMAAVLGTTRQMIEKRLNPDGHGYDPDFKAAYDRGKNSGKTSLRRAQWEQALKGNVVMQIWLGKQYLGQKDIVLSEVQDLPPLVIKQKSNEEPPMAVPLLESKPDEIPSIDLTNVIKMREDK